MFEIASETLKSWLFAAAAKAEAEAAAEAADEGPLGSVKGIRREPDWLDMTDEDTEVGEAGEPECSGLEEVGEMLLLLLLCDELLPFESVWANLWCSDIGALYVHTMRSLSLQPAESGRVSNNVFNELVMSSSTSAFATLTQHKSFWPPCNWS